MWHAFPHVELRINPGFDGSLHITARIVEQDFMNIKSNPALYKEWDVISLSLVLNFVPDALHRGHMLQLAYELLKLRGLLFIVVSIE